jgi:hypothetical protein
MSKRVSVSIKGMSPLLMHRFPMVPVEGLQNMPPEEQAMHAEYRDPDTKELFIPGPAVQQCLVAGATYVKGKGRGSAQKVVAASVLVMEERLGLGVKTYEIDSRPVVISATQGRIIRHRPKLAEWAVSFTITYDEKLLKEVDLRKVVDNAGSMCGLLDYRPSKKGPFGRFIVTEWTVEKDDEPEIDLPMEEEEGEEENGK